MKKTKNDMEKICAMCEHSEPLFDDENVLCEIRGIVSGTYHCRKFIYDPLKHVPPKMPKVAPLEYVDIEETDDEELSAAVDESPSEDKAEKGTDNEPDQEAKTSK